MLWGLLLVAKSRDTPNQRLKIYDAAGDETVNGAAHLIAIVGHKVGARITHED
jgi:hypothetical protein